MISPSHSIRIVVISAMPREIAGAARALGARRTRLGGEIFLRSEGWAFTAGGIGEARAEARARLAVENATPELLVSAGFVGALSDESQVGEIVIGGTPGIAASEPWMTRALSAYPSARRGLVATVPRVVNDAGFKLDLARKTGARVVDNEASAVANVAAAAGVAFLSVKVVLDTPREPLASSYEGIGAVAGEILRRPTVLLQMGSDASRAARAARALTEFFSSWASTSRGRL